MLDLLQEAFFHLDYQHQILKNLNAVTPFMEDKFKIFFFKVGHRIMDELQIRMIQNEENECRPSFSIPTQLLKVQLASSNTNNKDTANIPLILGPRLPLYNSDESQYFDTSGEKLSHSHTGETYLSSKENTNFEATEEFPAQVGSSNERTMEKPETNTNVFMNSEEPVSIDNVVFETNVNVDAENGEDVESDSKESWIMYEDDEEEFSDEENFDLVEDDEMYDPNDSEEEEIINDDDEQKNKPIAKIKKCNICGKEVKNLKSHKKAVHSVENAILVKCDICGKSLKPLSMRTHKLTHGEQKLFECNICHQRYSRKSTLQYHQAIHENVDKLQCEICGKNFNHENRLNLHILTHTGQKTYKCKECGKEFYHQYLLNRHVKYAHIAEESQYYSCDLCDKKYKSAYSLKIHSYIHTGNKRFECKVCGKKFIQKIELQLHDKQHSKKKFTKRTGKKQIASVNILK